MTSPCQKENSNNNKVKIKTIKKKVHQTLTKKYEILFNKYNSNIIDNIIYNERSHIVALFKDRLILDDNGEFLKRYYNNDESFVRLPKFFEYYDLYSKIFPNYTSLPEGKYFYQNIQKKQKMIDIQEQIELDKQKQKNIEEKSISISDNDNILNSDNYKNKDKEYVFTTDVINSILNGTNMEFVEILFNINKNNSDEEENIFSEKIKNIINVISSSENINKNNNNNINNKSNKKKNKKCQSSSKKKENKSNSSKKNKINKTVLGNDMNNNKIVKLNYFNKSTIRKNTIFNLNINKKPNNNSIYIKNNNNTNKIKNDKNYIKIIEHNIFNKKQIASKRCGKNKDKNLLHNVSSSTSIKRELSKSKRNSSNNSKKQSGSTSSYNILRKNNSLHFKIKNYNKISSNINNKKLEIKMKNSLNSPYPLTSRRRETTSKLNFSLNKKANKHNNIKTKYTYSSNNILNSKKHKKSLSNGERNKNRKNNNILNNFKKININNIHLHKKISNITNNIKNINKRKIMQYNNKHSNNINNNISNKKAKYKNNTYYVIDSRNFILNEFLNSYKRHKSNSTKKNSVNSRSSSRYNKSKSKSKSNKKNKNQKNVFDSNNSNLFNKKNKSKIITNKNEINKFNWKIDSRNKRALFISKNISKYKTKNIFQNDTSLKSSFLGAINNLKNTNKLNDTKNYSKIFKCINSKNCCSITQRNYSFNNI